MLGIFKVIPDIKMSTKSLIIIITYNSLTICEINLKLKQINIQGNIRLETFLAFVISSSIYGIAAPKQFCWNA